MHGLKHCSLPAGSQAAYHLIQQPLQNPLVAPLPWHSLHNSSSPCWRLRSLPSCSALLLLPAPQSEYHLAQQSWQQPISASFQKHSLHNGLWQPLHL